MSSAVQLWASLCHQLFSCERRRCVVSCSAVSVVVSSAVQLGASVLRASAAGRAPARRRHGRPVAPRPPALRVLRRAVLRQRRAGATSEEGPLLLPLLRGGRRLESVLRVGRRVTVTTALIP